jgi:hypothetical protein
MKRKIKNLNKRTKGIVVVSALFAVVGTAMIILTNAATGTASFSLTPASGSYDISTTFTVGVFVNGGTDLVNSVGPQITYDATKLDFISQDLTGGVFTDCFGNSGGLGVVSFNCSKIGQAFTGTQKIGNVTFRAKIGSGTTSLGFGVNSQIYKGDAEPIWNGVTTGGTYNLTTPDTTPPAVNITAPSTGSLVQGNAVAINATAVDNANTINRVEFWVNGVLKNTDTVSPYTYTWDSTTIADGTYPILVRAYDNAPTRNMGSATVSVQVKNNKPNLVVSSASLTPANPKPGDIVTISAVITNNGTDATVAGVSVATGFTIDSVAVSAPVDTIALAVGASRTVTTTWTATVGPHTLLVTADRNNTVVETNETDNTRTQSFVVYKPGDANNDGVIGLADLSILSNNFGKTGMTYATGDFNFDGIVNLADVSILSNNWGR